MADETSIGIDITPNKDGGVIKVIKREGEGTECPYPGDKVYVHYVGTLEDGTTFDSSRERGEKFEFDLGKGNVIKGWDLGVATMKRGELATLTCKPEYAYGEHGSPPKIGKNATLVFEVELFDWNGEDISEDTDGSIIRHQIKMGDGYTKPNEGAHVNIHLVGHHKGRLFEERDVEFVLGEGHSEGIVPGIEHALTEFKKGEHSKLELSANQAYGETGNEDYNIPPNSDLEYEVILNQFEKAKESWEMDAKEKIEQSEIIKTKGTTFFKAEDFNKAVTQYKKVVSFLEDESYFKSEDEKNSRSKLLLAAYLNLAMCYLRLDDYKETRSNCDLALVLDPVSTKALYRRAQAYDKENEHGLAISDYEKLLTIEAENKAAKAQLHVSRQKLNKFVTDQKRRYQGMFNKFAAQDLKNQKPEEQGDGDKTEEKNENGEDDYISSEGEAETTQT